jgi:hypothetical protein
VANSPPTSITYEAKADSKSEYGLNGEYLGERPVYCVPTTSIKLNAEHVPEVLALKLLALIREIDAWGKRASASVSPHLSSPVGEQRGD